MPSDLQITNIRDQANANSAITIASDGQITVNQNNPTLTLGANTAFPTGHVLQVQYKSSTAQMESTGSYVQLLDGAYITITKIAGSNIFLSWSTQSGKGGGSTYMNASKIERSTASNFSSITTLPASPDVPATEEPSGSVGYTGESTSNYIGNWGHTTIDEGITSSAGTYYYRVQVKSNGSSAYAGIDGGVSTFYAMEVKA